MTGRDWSQIENMGRLGLTKDFADDACDGVPDEEHAGCQPRLLEPQPRVRDVAQDEEHHDALECGFIKLARVSRQRSATGEDHADGCIRLAAPMLRIDEIRDAAKKDLLAKVQTDLCQEVFQFVANNQGVNEMAIYLALKHRDLNEVRQSLRVLKTARLLFENSGLWTADKHQAQFFFDLTEGERGGAVKRLENQTPGAKFIIDETFIRVLIDDLLAARNFIRDKAQIDLLIRELETTIQFV